MCEVDELEDAIDHGVPEGDESIYRAEGKAVYELLGEHERPPALQFDISIKKIHNRNAE
jgi:hypothetical protein